MYKTEAKLPKVFQEIFTRGKNGFLSEDEKRKIDALTGREIYNYPFSHVLNYLPIERILTFAFGDYELTFSQADQEVSPNFSLEKAIKNYLIDGYVFYRVDGFGINWLENVVSYNIENGLVTLIKQKWEYEDGTEEIHLYAYNSGTPIYIVVVRRGNEEIAREEYELDTWPIIGVAAENYFLSPVRYLLFRLDKIIDNIARSNDKHARDRLHIYGNIQDPDKLQAALNMDTADTAIVFPSDTTAEYPKIHNNVAYNQYELEMTSHAILACLNIVDVENLNLSGISRRLAMQPMLALAEKLRNIAEALLKKIAETSGLNITINFGSLEFLDINEKKVYLEMVDKYKDVIGSDAYKAEVMRIFDIKVKI